MYKLDNHNRANDMHPSPHSKTGNNPVKTIQYNPLETVYFKTNYNINISVYNNGIFAAIHMHVCVLNS